MSGDRALEAARRARRALVRGSTRDAAWLALWSTELDGESSLGLAVVARILHEVSGDPLATIVTRAACRRGLPDPERREVERFHRIDLWSRGLLAHTGGQSLLPASAFEDGASFAETPELSEWIEARTERWQDLDGACRALRRLVGALSDAWEMPSTGDPLRTPEQWADMPAYANWKTQDPLHDEEPDPLEEPDPAGITVISDHWTAHTIAHLEETNPREALEIAERWVELRPGRMAPLMTVMRVAHRMGDEARIEDAEATVMEIETEDLTELEEARVGLGLLQRYSTQMVVLNRMNDVAPGHPVVLANRGAVYLELGDTEKAEADLSLALQLEPHSGPALTNLALLRMRESDYVAARGLLEEAKKLHPKEAQVRYYLAACLDNQNHPEAALREAQTAVQLDPEFEPGHDLLAQLRTK